MKQKSKQQWLRVYFVIAYIIVGFLAIPEIYDSLNKPLEDRWEKVECLEFQEGFRITDSECEEHILYTNSDKLTTIIVYLTLWTVIPIFPPLVWRMLRDF